MPSDASFDTFEKELNRLVESFGNRLTELKQPGYAEAQLRDDFLNPFFRALGWDMENRAGLIQKEREVEIESATQIGGGRKRADYLFRTDKRDRFVCEAKKPAEELHARAAFQAKRYAWNKGVPVAVLSDFEELKIYIVGGKPHIDEPHVGEWKIWRFQQYPIIARELWDLLARDKIAAGSIDQALEALPKKAKGNGKARQQWLIKPDRTRALDTDFLEFLDEARRDLASDLYKNNDHEDLLEGHKLTEACQRVIDRILFLRICEDRDIDTGERLASIVDKWRKNTGNEDTGRRAHQQTLAALREEPPADFGSSGIRAPKDSLWRAVVRHFRALDRRPPTHVPFFNGNLFKPHFTENLILGDEWLAGFIGDLSDDESPYLFNVIDVEILGSVYERFLGKVVVLKGRGISIDDKPEVRKAGGVYYTPRYIVDYIVEQTAGKLLDEIAGNPVSSRVAAPHPNPLPQGEGTATSTSGKSKASASNPALDTILPLPGERAGVRADVTLKDFEKKTAALRLLDPACGSGSFLIRAFERVGEHWLRWLTSQLPAKTAKVTDVDWEKFSQAPVGTKPEAPAKAARSEWLKRHRKLCWLDEATGDLHLTIHLKRLILTNNIYGVDLDAAAVEVTQLSLYLKMLENENRTTLQRQRELLADEADLALLPPLQDNIKCGNSLIASDFSMMPEDLVRVHAFDWPVQFAPIMKAGGFDAVIGNPPWGALLDESELEYLREHHREIIVRMIDSFMYFTHANVERLKKGGAFGMILPDVMLYQTDTQKLRQHLTDKTSLTHICNMGDVFDQVTRPACIVVCLKAANPNQKVLVADFAPIPKEEKPKQIVEAKNFTEVEQNRISRVPGCLFTTSGFGNYALWERVSSSASDKLSDLVDADGIQRGVSPDLKEAFLVSSKVAKEWKLEKKNLRPVLTGGKQVKRYEIDRPDLLLVYTGREDDFRRLPNICSYIDQFKKEITCKEVQQKKHSIYSLHRAREEQIFLKPEKLLGVITEDEIILALDDGKTFATDGLYLFGVKPSVDIRYVMAVLNSRLFVSIYRLLSLEEGRALAQVKPTVLANLPIRKIDFSKPADKARHDKLVLLVDKLLGLMPKLRAATADSGKAVLQNAVTATDQQIDQLVYELYGLTEDEIKLVEGGQ